jgi:HK97 gp10 family phage protein
MISLEISTKGLDFDEVAEKLSGKVKRILIEKLLDVAYASAFWGAPWKKGHLSQSIVKEIDEDGNATLRASASYAVYVEKGTAPHEIRPANASVLAFQAMGGEMVFTKLVRHPGTPPNPFMQRAVEAAREKVEETFAELWLEMLNQ